MKKALILIAAVFSHALFAQAKSEGVILSFKHKAGDSASYISTVRESVTVNGRLDHTAEIINRISSKITNVDSNGTATIEATYMTTEKADNFRKTIAWGEEFNSVFDRKKNGEMKIDPSYFMPTVRNVPVFPDYKVKPGDTWQADGHEAEDLRNTFNVPEPYMVPFTAKYKYLRDETTNGVTLNVIQVQYNLYYDTPVEIVTDKYMPASTMGSSTETIFWDNQKGIIDHYTEDFKIVIENFYGDVFIFKGISGAEVTEFTSINNDENLAEMEKAVNQMDLKDVTVKKGDRGLTISIENIQFLPDSAVLLPEEKNKLKKIATILMNFENDLLVTGHCADRGTEQARQQLSEERADTVADFLKNLGVRDEYHIFTSGKGAREPIADNLTVEGRAKNRRVEITILE